MRTIPLLTTLRARRGARAILPLALALALGSCGASDGPLLIGVAGPFSEPRGLSMKRAAELAIAAINDAGGVNGRLLAPEFRDDSANNARAIAVAQELRDNPRVVAVVGHLTSGPTIAAADIYNGGDDPVVEISPSASNPDLTGIGRYTFRVCPTDLAHGTALARYAFRRLGARAAAVIYLNDDYGRGILGTFSEEFQQLGGELVAHDPVLGGGTELGPYLERIARNGRAQVLMVAGDRAAAVAVLRAARQRGVSLPVIGGDGLIGIQSEGALAEGVFVSTNYLADRAGELNAAFVRRYAEAYGGERPDHRGAGAWDAIHLIAQALRESGPSRRKVRDALARVTADRPYEGVTGTIAFDERGDVPEKTVVIGVVRGGRIVLAEGQ